MTQKDNPDEAKEGVRGPLGIIYSMEVQAAMERAAHELRLAQDRVAVLEAALRGVQCRRSYEFDYSITCPDPSDDSYCDICTLQAALTPPQEEEA